MPSPTTSLATLRPELGTLFQFDPDMDRQGFIANRVCPVLEVQKQSGAFGKITLANLLATRTTKRASGSGYNRQKWEFDDASFSCEEHGAEEVVDDREAQMYADYLDAEAVSLMRARDVVLRNYEQRVADLIFNTSTWTGSSLTTAIGTAWSTVATATPVTDVAAAVLKVYDGSGLWPNALIINRKVFLALRRCAQIIDLCKAQGFMDVRQGTINEQQLAQVFDLEQVIVAGSSKNSANEGATATPVQIWSNTYAMVARVATGNDIKEPCIARTFHWGQDGSSIGGTVESYRDETVRGNVIRARMDTDEVVMYAQAGHLLSNAHA